jgi:hypothetical protein
MKDINIYINKYNFIYIYVCINGKQYIFININNSHIGIAPALTSGLITRLNRYNLCIFIH